MQSPSIGNILPDHWWHHVVGVRTLRPAFAALLFSGMGLWWTGVHGYAQQEPAATVAPILATLYEQDDIHVSKPQVSPDGRYVALTIVPLGTETAFLAQTHLYETATALLRHTLPGHTPRWLSIEIDDSPLLQLENVQRTAVVYQIGDTIRSVPLSQIGEPETGGIRQSHEPTLGDIALTADLAYPATIRVAHHPSNGCRDVADWQVDVIPFEEYVARVIPAETPASWPLDALAAQAVAVRTYAWYQILVQRADYDVTDWANFQVMCDKRYPNSDAAVMMTTGQYLTSVDYVAEQRAAFPISAMYSAENGHPTLTNANVTYLQSVPDLFALGRRRWGHGYGLSQWGAYRRARAGQNYRQILGHYYSNVYLTNGNDPQVVMGAIVGSVPKEQRGSDAVTLQAMVHPALTPRFVITASQGLTSPVVIEANANEVIWRPPRPLAHGTRLTATLWLHEQRQDVRSWQIDHRTPTSLAQQINKHEMMRSLPTFSLPDVATQPLVTVTLPLTEDIPLLTRSLRWEGEALLHTANSGTVVSDTLASNGAAWSAVPTEHGAGVWYGPYTSALTPGHSYRALFWLRTIALTDTTYLPDTLLRKDRVAGIVRQSIPVARLDVVDDEGRVLLGVRDLQLSDFSTDQGYMPIAVDFHLFDRPQGVEFRVAWFGQVLLLLDQIEIWQQPDHMSVGTPGEDSASFQWDLRGQPVAAPFHIRYMDRAGNLGDSYSHDIVLADTSPPLFKMMETSVRGVTTVISAAISTTIITDPLPPILVAPSDTVTVTVTVTDSFSGLDVKRRAATLTDGTAIWPLPLSAAADATPWQTSRMTAVIPALDTLPVATALYTVTISAYDQVGNRADMHRQVMIDTTPPTVTLNIPQLPQAGWYLEPITVTMEAIDMGSGVATIAYTLTRYSTREQVVSNRVAVDQRNRSLGGREAGGSDSTAIRLEQAGMYTLTVQAVDLAGNRSRMQSFSLLLDLSAPTVTLWQSTVNRSIVHLSWHSSDDGSGVAYLEVQAREGEQAWDALPWGEIEPTAGVDIPIDPQQLKAVRIRVQDRVGRWSEWVEINLWIATDWIYLPLIHAN